MNDDDSTVFHYNVVFFSFLFFACCSVDELFEKVLERLESDYKENDDEGKLVEQVISVLSTHLS
jgi:hypothetical protein